MLLPQQRLITGPMQPAAAGWVQRGGTCSASRPLCRMNRRHANSAVTSAALASASEVRSHPNILMQAELACRRQPLACKKITYRAQSCRAALIGLSLAVQFSGADALVGSDLPCSASAEAILLHSHLIVWDLAEAYNCAYTGRTDWFRSGCHS